MMNIRRFVPCALRGALLATLALTLTATASHAQVGPAAPPVAPTPELSSSQPAPETPTAEPPPVVAEPAPVVEAQPEPVATVKDAQASKDQKPAVHVTYDKGFVLASEDDKFETRIALRTQFRFESSRPTEDGSEFLSRTYIARARLQLEGHVYGKDNRYKLETSLGDRGSFTFVRDAYLEHKFSSVWLRVGQWKRPHNRQELVSDFSSVFNERAVTADFVGGGRDMGLALHNDYEKSPEGLEWVVGVFNGFSGGADRPALTTTCTANATTGAITCRNATPPPSTLVARAGWNVGKIKGYSEGDLEGGPLRVAVGASYKLNLANFDKGAQSSVSKNFSHSAQADVLLKSNGLDVLAAVYVQKLAGGDTELGALLQGGYFVTPKQLQLAGRFAFHQAPGDRNQLEGRVAVNYYLAGHSYKLASDAGFLQLTGEDAMGVKDKADLQARVMAQMTF
ncbi:MAG: hypothetical protein IPI49_22365 [Myxococcales bacterium]|nr:hypothetical protein [Myxococcales bacterium]